MNDLLSYELNDPNFDRDLENSKIPVALAAKLMLKAGKAEKIEIRPTYLRPHVSQMRQYSDDGDIFAWVRGIRYVVEVKKREFEFTNSSDYPYQRTNDWGAMVCNVHNWEERKEKPLMYIIFNKSLTRFMIIAGHTRKHWTSHGFWDRKHGRNRRAFYCPLQHVTFRGVA